MSSAPCLVPGDRFVPWAYAVNPDWPLVPLCTVAAINERVLPETTPPNRRIRYVDISSVDSTGTITVVADLIFESAPSRARRVPADGDTIVSTVRTYLKAVAFIQRPEQHLVCSTGFAVLSPRPVICPKYLFYWTLSDHFLDEICARSVGVSYPALRPSEMGHLPVAVPPLSMQRSIADLLDRKTAAIDALIAKKEQLLDHLSEKREATIDVAVRTGVKTWPTLKDSGVASLGRIPSHWGIAKVKHEMARIVDCPHSTPEYAPDGEYPAVRTSDVDRGRLNLASALRVSRADYWTRVERLEPTVGDILYSREGERFGMAALVPAGVKLCLAQRMMLFRPRHAASARYLMWALNSQAVYQQVKQETVGATSPRINIPTIANAWIPVPPLDEQVAIADFIECVGGQVDTCASTVRNQLRAFAEYRQALITAAVTGQLHVTERPQEAA